MTPLRSYSSDIMWHELAGLRRGVIEQSGLETLLQDCHQRNYTWLILNIWLTDKNLLISHKLEKYKLVELIQIHVWQNTTVPRLRLLASN